MEGKYANIIIDISHEKVDKPFQYKIPEHLRGKLEVGMSVAIPFGSTNKERSGYIIEITDLLEYEEDKLKEIIEVTKGGMQVEENLIKLAWWMKEQYGSTMITALKTVLPVKKKEKHLEKKKIILCCTQEEAEEKRSIFKKKHYSAKERLIAELIETPEIPYEFITEKLHVSSKTIEAFVQENLIKITSHNVYRNPVKGEREAENRKSLSQEQQHIVNTVLEHRKAGIHRNYLIKGITGSGKTEVYMELIEAVIEKGQQAIMLIPEIALTYQTVLRFYKRFGDRVSVMNSKLSPGERFDQTQRAKKGEIDIMIGPRSALFTPFSNIGIIIIDEEHENSYKSETMPKYHARDIAFQLAIMHKASVVLGSATPSLESYYMAKGGVIDLFELTKRLTGGMLPKVYVEDLRKELKEGNRSIFSTRLQTFIQGRLEAKEQIMLFLNRRGYAGFVSCRACGHVMKCPHCDVSLSEHKNGKLICHYCGYETPGVKTCPECGSKYILGFRAGTQQLEELIHKMFPLAAVLRMDADTTRKKDGYDAILSAFSNGDADILVGTQMIVKGHDFPNVTLVGILAADLSLSANDFRASERTFQLLTQAAGRAGRGEKPGEVVIQTYQPEHYSIIHASNQDYDAFYEEEILYRSMLKYPPVSQMLAVLVNASDEVCGKELIIRISEVIKPMCFEKRAGVIGPASASIGKINDIFRFILYVKHQKYDMLVTIKNEIEQWISQQELKNESVQFDFNPMSGY